VNHGAPQPAHAGRTRRQPCLSPWAAGNAIG